MADGSVGHRVGGLGSLGSIRPTVMIQDFAVLYDAVLYDALFDDALFDEAHADDEEHTVVAVSDSDGWALEFGQSSVSLENVEANGPVPPYSGVLDDRAEALALVEVFLTGGAEAVRASLQAQS